MYNCDECGPTNRVCSVVNPLDKGTRRIPRAVHTCTRYSYLTVVLATQVHYLGRRSYFTKLNFPNVAAHYINSDKLGHASLALILLFSECILNVRKVLVTECVLPLHAQPTFNPSPITQRTIFQNCFRRYHALCCTPHVSLPSAVSGQPADTRKLSSCRSWHHRIEPWHEFAHVFPTSMDKPFLIA